MEDESQATTRIFRCILGGRGWVTYALTRRVLATFLEAAEAPTFNEVADDFLRDLCRHDPENDTDISSYRFSEGNSHFRSEDLGIDLTKRLAASYERMDQLCDPQYSPVWFQLRQIEDNTDLRETTPFEAMRLGQLIMIRLLEPPNLA